MTRKLTLLAIAVLALAASATPTTAWAEEEPENWTMGESLLEEEAAAVFDGQMQFNFFGGTGSIECKVQLTHTLEPKKSTGHVTKFSATGCTTAGTLSVCAVTASNPQNLPWVAHAAKNGPVRFISITGISVKFTVKNALCLILLKGKNTIEVNGNAQAFPDIFTSISSEEFNAESGTLESNIESPVSLSGTLTIEGEEAGTYGME